MAINTEISPFQFSRAGFFAWKAGKNRHHATEPLSTLQDGRIAQTIATNGTPDGRKITVVTGHSAGGADGFVTNFTNIHHLHIPNGTKVFIDQGFSKWFDRRPAEMTVNSDADFATLLAIMLHPRDPRECKIYVGQANHPARFTLGHTGVAGNHKQISYHWD